VLFVAGLEGTGHHFFDRATFEMNASRIRFAGNWNAGGMDRADASWSREHLAENAQLLEDAVRAHPDQVIMVEAVWSSSWPNGHGNSDARRYRRRPSIPLLLEAASLAGRALGQDVNVQVLVTQRKAEETLVATCLHRTDLEPCASQSETLAINARALAEQLQQVNLPAMHCVRYNDLPSLASGLAAALVDEGRSLSEAKAAVDRAWYGEEHHDPESDTASVAEWAKAMGAPLSEIDSMCDSSRQRAEAEAGIAPQPNARRANVFGMSPYIWQVIGKILPAAALRRAESRLAGASA